MTAAQRRELEYLTVAQSCALSDLSLVLMHIVTSKKYDEAAIALISIKHKTDIVAGYVSQLLPVTKTTDQTLSP